MIIWTSELLWAINVILKIYRYGKCDDRYLDPQGQPETASKSQFPTLMRVTLKN